MVGVDESEAAGWVEDSRLEDEMELRSNVKSFKAVRGDEDELEEPDSISALV